MVTVRVYDGDKKVFANAIPESYMYYLLDRLNKDFSDQQNSRNSFMIILYDMMRYFAKEAIIMAYIAFIRNI